MIPKMALAPDTDQLHVSWAPDRDQRTGVAASVQSISKRFKKARVLEDVSFDVAETQKLVAEIAKSGELTAKQKAELTKAASDRLTQGFRDNTWYLQTRGTDYDLAPPAGETPGSDGSSRS